MALNTVTLAAALKTSIKAAHLTLGAANNAALETFCINLGLAIATDIVTHIQTNAAVTVVTVCGSGAGTGTGTVG